MEFHLVFFWICHWFQHFQSLGSVSDNKQRCCWPCLVLSCQIDCTAWAFQLLQPIGKAFCPAARKNPPARQPSRSSSNFYTDAPPQFPLCHQSPGLARFIHTALTTYPSSSTCQYTEPTPRTMATTRTANEETKLTRTLTSLTLSLSKLPTLLTLLIKLS